MDNLRRLQHPFERLSNNLLCLFQSLTFFLPFEWFFLGSSLFPGFWERVFLSVGKPSIVGLGTGRSGVQISSLHLLGMWPHWNHLTRESTSYNGCEDSNVQDADRTKPLLAILCARHGSKFNVVNLITTLFCRCGNWGTGVEGTDPGSCCQVMW